MNPTVLAYNFEGQELKKLKKLCSGKGVRLRSVQPGDFAQPVGALCGAEKRLSDPAAEAAPGGRMLVFANPADRQLESLLAELRTARVGTDALKAVLTPHNAKWTAARLYAELEKERDAMR